MEENKESAKHFYAKHALVDILCRIDTNCSSKGHYYNDYYYCIEYPFTHENFEEDDFPSFDEKYMITPEGEKKSDYPGRITITCKDRSIQQIHAKASSFYGYCEVGEVGFSPTRFHNYRMPTMEDYKNSKIYVKYISDVVKLRSGWPEACYEIVHSHPSSKEKLHDLSWHFPVYEIPANYILSFDYENPDTEKFVVDCETNFRVKNKEKEAFERERDRKFQFWIAKTKEKLKLNKNKKQVGV